MQGHRHRLFYFFGSFVKLYLSLTEKLLDFFFYFRDRLFFHLPKDTTRPLLPEPLVIHIPSIKYVPKAHGQILRYLTFTDLTVGANEVIEDLKENAYEVVEGVVGLFGPQGELIREYHPGEFVLNHVYFLSVITEVPVAETNVTLRTSTLCHLKKASYDQVKQQGNLGLIATHLLVRILGVTLYSAHTLFGFSEELFIGVGEDKVIEHDPKTAFANFLGIETNDLFSHSDEGFETLKFERRQVIQETDREQEGLYLVAEGSVNLYMIDETREQGERRRFIRQCVPGEIVSDFGIFGLYKSIIELEVTDNTVLTLYKKTVFEPLLSSNPNIYDHISKRILTILSPFFLELDFAFSEFELNSGLILLEKHEKIDRGYLVLHGRLHGHLSNGSNVVEYKRKNSFGFNELAANLEFSSTVFSVRDSVVSSIGRYSLDFVSLRYPRVLKRTIQIMSREFKKVVTHPASERKTKPSTITIVPLHKSKQVDDYIQDLIIKLHAEVKDLDEANRDRRVKDLERSEDSGTVIFIAKDQNDAKYNKFIFRQSDLILLIAESQVKIEYGNVPYLQLLKENEVAKKELLLIHHDAKIEKGVTYRWLRYFCGPIPNGDEEKNICYIQRFHHVSVDFEKDYALYEQTTSRVVRYLKGKSVGVVLGGGGARGFTHISIIETLRKKGIPIDFVGGTSMGSFIGSVYSSNPDITSLKDRSYVLAKIMGNYLYDVMDLTIPLVSWFAGNSLNGAVSTALQDDTFLEDNWIDYYCISVDVTHTEMRIHRDGLLWKYTRASMSLPGFVPPINENGTLLVDGGFMNILPYDVMREIPNIGLIISVDVGGANDQRGVEYGTFLHGYQALLTTVKNFFTPKVDRVKTTNTNDIQSRLTFITSTKKVEELKKLYESGPEVNKNPTMVYMKPDVDQYSTMDFQKFNKIYSIGKQYAEDFVAKDQYISKYLQENKHY